MGGYAAAQPSSGAAAIYARSGTGSGLSSIVGTGCLGGRI